MAGPHQKTSVFVGDYEILGRLAAGGMAEILLARLEGTEGFEKQVALKRLLPKYARNPEYSQMFIEEARILARLQHKNIVQIFDVAEAKGVHYLVMEHLQGVDVRKIMHAYPDGRVPLEHAIQIANEVCTGLHYAHEMTDASGRSLDVVHRDISPANVIVTLGGDVKLIDFGIATAAGREFETQTGIVKGTEAYMSPEQARCQLVDRRSDVYSLAVVLFEMTTGKLPTRNGRHHLAGRREVESPRTIVPDYPPELEATLLRALAMSPDDRQQTAQALQDELLSVAAGYGLPVSTEALGSLARSIVGQAAEIGSAPTVAVGSPGSEFQSISLRPLSSPPAPADAPPIVARAVGGAALGAAHGAGNPGVAHAAAAHAAVAPLPMAQVVQGYVTPAPGYVTPTPAGYVTPSPGYVTPSPAYAGQVARPYATPPPQVMAPAYMQQGSPYVAQPIGAAMPMPMPMPIPMPQMGGQVMPGQVTPAPTPRPTPQPMGIPAAASPLVAPMVMNVPAMGRPPMNEPAPVAPVALATSGSKRLVWVASGLVGGIFLVFLLSSVSRRPRAQLDEDGDGHQVVDVSQSVAPSPVASQPGVAPAAPVAPSAPAAQEAVLQRPSYEMPTASAPPPPPPVEPSYAPSPSYEPRDPRVPASVAEELEQLERLRRTPDSSQGPRQERHRPAARPVVKRRVARTQHEERDRDADDRGRDDDERRGHEETRNDRSGRGSWNIDSALLPPGGR